VSISRTIPPFQRGQGGFDTVTRCGLASIGRGKISPNPSFLKRGVQLAWQDASSKAHSSLCPSTSLSSTTFATDSISPFYLSPVHMREWFSANWDLSSPHSRHFQSGIYPPSSFPTFVIGNPSVIFSDGSPLPTGGNDKAKNSCPPLPINAGTSSTTAGMTTDVLSA
jgi:hypothetical protein